MALRREDLAGQREALTEDVDDGSGGERELESQAPECSTPAKQKLNPKAGSKLMDSVKPCLMITALLATFAFLVIGSLIMVQAAFDAPEAQLNVTHS